MKAAFPETVAEIARGLAAGAFSSHEITADCLERIAAQDGTLNSFITRCNERALAAASAADRARARGEAGPLAGVPYANKDIFCTEGVPTTAPNSSSMSNRREGWKAGSA